MVRVTLEKDFGRPIRMCFGYPISVPMQFGGIDPSVTVNFRADPVRIAVEPNTWALDFARPDMRSTTMPEEVALHYFGDPRSTTADNEEVKSRKIPNFNDERMRVAQVWGDYLYSDQHGFYSTVKIKVPDVPRIAVHALDHNMQPLADAPVYRPWEKFHWEELLDPSADIELEMLAARKPTFVRKDPQPIDISTLTGAQLDQLAKQLALHVKKAG